jgi:hypothetical protein
LTVLVAGNWESSGSVTEGMLRAAWDDLATGPTGRLLSLDRPVSGPVVQVDASVAALEVDLDAARLVDGLRAAVGAGVREMMGLANENDGGAGDSAPPRRSHGPDRR